LFAYLAERPELQERIREVDEEVGYVVESKLLAAMKRGDVSAVIFYCATKLKMRGYTRRVETVGPDGPILVEAPLPTPRP
jgi:hypothetical protein